MIPIKIVNKHCSEIFPEESNFKIIYIDVVHRCNMECTNCYLPNRDYEDVPFEKIKNFVDRFQYSVEFRLIGGEPTLHNDLDKIIKYINSSKLKHSVVLITNGLKLASYKYLKSLVDSGLKYVYLSMNGFDEDFIYEKVDNMKCAKNKMMALKNCQKENLTLSIGFIVVKNLNEHLLDKMKSYFYDYRKVVNFEIRNIGQVGRNSVDDLGLDNYTYEELEQLILEKFDINKEDFKRKDQYSTLYRKKSYYIQLHNWKDLPNGFDDLTNERRGRMTENFLVAPFLEHIVRNEGYY